MKLKNIIKIVLIIILFVMVAFCLFKKLTDSFLEKERTGIFVNMPIVWRTKPSRDIVSSVTHDEKNVYFRTSNAIYALDGQTGKEIWKYPSLVLDELALPPYITDSFLIIPERNSRVTILKKNSGELSWQSKPPQSAFTNAENLYIDSVSFNKNTVFVARFNWKLTAYDISSGNILWEHDLPNRTNPYVVTNGSDVFLGVGQQLMSIEADTGKILWQFEIPGFVGNMYFSEGENQIVAADVEGPNLFVIEPEKGKIVKTIALNISSEFGIKCIIEHEDNLIVSADGLSIVSKFTGSEKWYVNHVGHLECPVVVDNKIFVRNTGTTLFAYDLVKGINLGEMMVEKNTSMAHEPNRGPTSINNLFIVPVSANELIAYRP